VNHHRRQPRRNVNREGWTFHSGQRNGSWPRSRSYNVSAYTDVIACENDSHSSTASSELVRALTCKFEPELCKVVASIGCEEFTPTRFAGALSGLRTMLAGIGRDALTRLLKERDVASPSIEVDGRRARFRESSECEWITAFGKIPVPRRTYRGDGPSAPSVVPLDQACGMTNRFMTPDVGV